MSRMVQIIIVVSIVCCAVEICSLLVVFIEPPIFTSKPYLPIIIDRTEIIWKVYWFSGLAVTITGLFLSKKLELFRDSLFVTGICLMLIGNNGGFGSTGYIIPRLVTTFITLSGLLYFIREERWSNCSPGK